MTTPPVSRDTVASAVAALGKWMRGRSAASKPQLLLDDRDDFFVLQLSLRRIPSKGRTNPFLLPIPHPIFPFSDPTLSLSLFLIIDDRNPNSPPPSKFLEEGKECNLPISEVIGLSTLRTDYRPFESRRKLCGSHDLFLADKTILPMLPRLLGKIFFQKKKIPLPVDFSRVGWKDQIKRILNSTFFYLRSGTCSGIRVGRLSMEVEQIVDNVMVVIDEAVQKIPKKWGNVRSLHVKAVDSVALPVYQAMPEIGLKIEVGERGNPGTEEILDRDEEVEEKIEKKKKKKKGGVRYTDEVALAGEELVDEYGEEEGVKEKNKKRKKHSKEGSGGESNVVEMEVNTKKKKKKQESGDVEEVERAEKMKKKQGSGDVEEVERAKKMKKKQGSAEVEEVDKAEKTKKKKKEKVGHVDRMPVVSEEIVEKIEGKEKRKGKKSEAKEEVRKSKKSKMKV